MNRNLLKIAVLLGVLAGCFIFELCAMEMRRYSPSTYQGVEITPKTLLGLAPKMPPELKEQVRGCLQKYHGFIAGLVTTPHPLTHETRKQKTLDNMANIALYEETGEVKNLSKVNYVLHFTQYPSFVTVINRWGSRMAYWIYASGQGSVLDPNFLPDFDCSKFEYMPSYQHCSRVAHYLRLKELMEKNNFQNFRTPPAYFKHIPGKPKELSDENYVVIQGFIPNLKELHQMSVEEQQEVRKNIPLAALKEIHAGVVYAALWNIAGNLAIDGTDTYFYMTHTASSQYYMAHLEEPFNHKPQFFYFQGQEGRKKYVEDTIAGLERMAKTLLNLPEQLAHWKQLTEDDNEFKQICDEYNLYPNYDPEHLLK